MRLELAAIVTALIATLGITPAAHADTPISPYPDAPLCSNLGDLNCQTIVVNILRGGYFCQIVGTKQRCETYWPFRNPTVNAHGASFDREAFPADYEVAKVSADQSERRAARLEERVARKNARIDHLLARVERLRDRLHSR